MTLLETNENQSNVQDNRRKSGYLNPKSKFADVVMFFGVIYFMIPLVWIVVASTKTKNDLFQTFSLGFGHSNSFFTNIAATFRQDNGAFGHWLFNTLFYAVTAAFLSTVTATMAGYSLAHFKYRGSRLVESLILGMVMVPGTALVMPLYLLFAKIHLVNTIWSVILPSVLNPFGAFLMRVYITNSVPEEMLQAARIDRASEFKIFFRIVLPILKPALLTVFLFSLVASWNNYFLPLVMLSSEKLYPLAVGLNTWFGQASQYTADQTLYNCVIDGALIAIVPLIISFIFLQKYWRGGLTAGAVK
jgi:multiple sugar transport system permease protein